MADSSPDKGDAHVAPIHRAGWDGWIRFDSDCIINGYPVKAGTSWGPFTKSKETASPSKQEYGQGYERPGDELRAELANGSVVYFGSASAPSHALPSDGPGLLATKADMEGAHARGEMLPSCPRCQSTNPKHHPATGFEGEVQLCRHPWHSPTADEIEAKERAESAPSARGK